MDAHRDDGKRFVVHADEELTALWKPNLRFVLAANCLYRLAYFPQTRTSVNGFESGGAFFPRQVLRLFRTRDSQNQRSGGTERKNQMKHLSILTLTIIVLSSFMATTVQADSPHFVRGPTASLDNAKW